MMAGEFSPPAEELFDRNFDFFRFRLFGFRKSDCQDAVFVAGADFARVDSRRQSNAATEFAAEALRSLGVFTFTGGMAFTGDRQHAVMQGDIDLLLLQPGISTTATTLSLFW